MSYLSLDRIKEQTMVLGPGTRAAVWFHGRPRHCPGCIASVMNASSDVSRLTPEELSTRVLKIDGIEGLTLSGGEPFAQNPDLMKVFLSSVRTTGLSVMAYTGYLREDLEADEGKRGLLEFIDVLVDGPYVEGEDQDELWRGSSNQRIHFLTTRYSHYDRTVERKKGYPLEMKFGEGASFTFAGIPPKGFRGRLENGLRRKSFVIDW